MGWFGEFLLGVCQPPRKIRSVFHLCYNNITVEKTDDEPAPKPKLGDQTLNGYTEKVQDWIKRVLDYLFKHKVLNDEEIYRLHDLNYSKRTFGLGFPLFIDSADRRHIKGHSRYWKKPIGKYYVCSEWWKDHDAEYTSNINSWLKKVLPDYANLGLGRK